MTVAREIKRAFNLVPSWSKEERMDIVIKRQAQTMLSSVCVFSMELTINSAGHDWQATICVMDMPGFQIHGIIYAHNDTYGIVTHEGQDELSAVECIDTLVRLFEQSTDYLVNQRSRLTKAETDGGLRS